MCNCNNCDKEKCRLAVSVEDDFAPCTFPKKMFDVEIRSRDGSFEALGKVAAGGSQIFDLPCDDDGKEYAVTVIGDMNSSPRAQTRRVCCCCGSTSGVTFIFMACEPECEHEHKPYPPCPPPCHHMVCVELPPKPPCPCDDTSD